MAAETLVGRASYAAIDLTRGEVRGYADGRVLRCPAAVFADEAGTLSFGRAAIRLGLTAPDRLEAALPDWIGDGHLALGTHLFWVADLLRGLLQHVLGGLGASDSKLDLLVLTVPGYWGGPRLNTLDHCAGGLAGRVEFASSATAILAGALLDFPELDLRKVLVLEQEVDRAIAYQVSSPTRLLPSERLGQSGMVALSTGTPCGGGTHRGGEADVVVIDVVAIDELLGRVAGKRLPGAPC